MEKAKTPAPFWVNILTEDMNDYGSPNTQDVENFIFQLGLTDNDIIESGHSKSKTISVWSRSVDWNEKNQRKVLSLYNELIFKKKYANAERVLRMKDTLGEHNQKVNDAKTFFDRLEAFKKHGLAFSTTEGLKIISHLELSSELGDFIDSSVARREIQLALQEYENDPDNAIKRLKHIVETACNALGHTEGELPKKLGVAMDSLALFDNPADAQFDSEIKRVKNGIKSVILGINEMRNGLEHRKKTFSELKIKQDFLEFSIVFVVAFLRLFERQLEERGVQNGGNNV